MITTCPKCHDQFDDEAFHDPDHPRALCPPCLAVRKNPELCWCYWIPGDPGDEHVCRPDAHYDIEDALESSWEKMR
jgi:hypothetical protein